MPNQVAHLPFSQGLNEQGAAALIGPEYVLSVQNLVQSNDDGWTKRNGFTNLGNGFAAGGTFTSPILRIARFRNAPFIIDGHNIIGYGAASNTLTSHDRIPECVATRRTIMSANQLAGGYSIAALGNFICVAVVTDPVGDGAHSSLTVSILDATSNEYIFRPAGLTSTAGASPLNSTPRVLVLGTKFIILYGDPGATSIKRWAIDTANLAGAIGSNTIVSNLTGSSQWDACVVDSTHYCIAYFNNSGGGSQLTVSLFTAAGNTPSTTTANGVIAPLSIGCACNPGDTLWIGWSEAPINSVKTWMLNPTTLATTGTTSVCFAYTAGLDPLSLTFAITGTQTAQVFTGNNASENTIWYGTIGLVGGFSQLVGSIHKAFRLRVLARPFATGGRVYVPVISYYVRSSPRAQQPTNFLVDFTLDSNTVNDPTPRPVATIAPRLIETKALVGTLPVHGDVCAVGSTFQWMTAVLRSSIGSGIELVTADFSVTNKWQPGELGASLLLACGMPISFSGTTASEVGFLTFPDQLAVADSTVAGTLTGTYFYTCIYEWISDSGDLVRSAPCVPAQVTVAAKKVDVSGITGLNLTTKSDALSPNNLPRIVIYRTTGTGTTYYRLPDSATPQHPIPNTPNILATFRDNNPDSSITGNEQLYRQVGVASTVPTGTVYARQNPPSATIGLVHNGRWWIVADDQTTIYYTGQQVSGEQPWFNDNFFVQVPDGGPITGLGSLDSALVIFKRDRIYVVDMGFGPGDDGSGNDIGQPQILSVDVGAVDQRSIVRTPDGLMFQSPIGIYTLTRSRQVAYTGWKVQNRLKAFPYVQSATLIEAQGRVFFELSAADPPGPITQGLTLVWDYIGQLWSTDIRTNDFFGAGAPALGGITINGVYHWVDYGGIIHQETPGVYLDVDQGSTHWVTAQIETAWLKGSGFQGWMSAKRATFLLNKNSNCDLAVSAAYDYSASYADPVRTFTYPQVAALNGSQLEKVLRTDPCESVRFKLTDASPTTPGAVGTGQGMNFVGLSFEFEALEGMYRLPAGAR